MKELNDIKTLTEQFINTADNFIAKQKEKTMEATEYKTNKTEEQCLQELKEGKEVKAKDLMSAMGIKVFDFTDK